MPQWGAWINGVFILLFEEFSPGWAKSQVYGIYSRGGLGLPRQCRGFTFRMFGLLA